MNFWSLLRVARVVGCLSGGKALALTLPSPLIRTRPCDPHGRGTSLDPKNETGRRADLLVCLLVAFSGFPLLLFTLGRN